MFDTSSYYIIGLALVVIAVLLLLTVLLQRRKRRPDAATLYVRALQALLDGDQVTAFYRLKDTVSQDSNNVDAYVRLGRILADRGNYENAIRIHSDLLLRPNLSPQLTRSIRAALIDDYAQDGQIDKAVELLRQDFERNPREQHLGKRLLDLLITAERWEEAEQIAERAYKYDRDTFRGKYAEILLARGEQHQQKGRGKKARVAYKDAFKVDDSRIEAWVKLGDSYLAENRVDDAVKSWRTLTESDPGAARLVIDRLAKSLFDLGKFNALGGILEGILENDPSNREAAMALADLSVKKSDFGRAEEYYRRILEVEPDYLPAAVGLARAYREQGKIDEAFNSLEQIYSRGEVASEEG